MYIAKYLSLTPKRFEIAILHVYSTYLYICIYMCVYVLSKAVYVTAYNIHKSVYTTCIMVFVCCEYYKVDWYIILNFTAFQSK